MLIIFSGLPGSGKSTIARALAQLIRCYEASSLSAYPTIDHRVHQACQILSESLCAEISVEALAEQVFLSPSRLAHLFREQVGVSIVRWREDQRIMRAKLLLQTTPLSVATIGQQVGYDDQLYFSRVFRKRPALGRVFGNAASSNYLILPSL